MSRLPESSGAFAAPCRPGWAGKVLFPPLFRLPGRNCSRSGLAPILPTAKLSEGFGRRCVGCYATRRRHSPQAKGLFILKYYKINPTLVRLTHRHRLVRVERTSNKPGAPHDKNNKA